VRSSSSGRGSTHISTSLRSTHLGRKRGGVGLEGGTSDSNGDSSLEVTGSWLDADSTDSVGTSVNSDSSRRELEEVQTSGGNH